MTKILIKYTNNNEITYNTKSYNKYFGMESTHILTKTDKNKYSLFSCVCIMI